MSSRSDTRTAEKPRKPTTGRTTRQATASKRASSETPASRTQTKSASRSRALEPQVSANARLRGGRYSLEEIERGLLEVVLCGGNTHRAARQLKARGMGVPRPTLQKWVATRADLMEEVRRRALPRVAATIAAEAEDAAIRSWDVEMQALDRLEEVLPALSPGELSTTIRNLATSRGISIDKGNAMRGRPTQVVEHVQLEDLLKKLASYGVIECDAEELPDVELEESTGA